MTEEHKRKIGSANKGKTTWIKGKHHSEETRKKISASNIGMPNPMSEETRKKISVALKGKMTKNFLEFQAKSREINKLPKGEKAWNWKGDGVSYSGLHSWVKRMLGHPTICSECGKDNCNIHWANKSREYKRDVGDWMPLCVSCHWKYDKPYLNRVRDSNGRFE